MSELLKKLRLPEEGSRVLCAVSGGADSMCLLELLLEWGGCEIAAAHFEHGIRGEESLRDRDFVKEYCREHGVECFIGSGDAPGIAAERGISLEQAARELRYDFLERTAAEHVFDYIATAHNADDNVETVIFNLARGTGTKGLCGIPPRRGRIIRPQLAIGREEIERYLCERGIPHVEDSTNADDTYSRNRIRHTVIPALRAIDPALGRAVARTGELLRRDDECLEEMAQSFIAANFDGRSLDAAELCALHPAVGSRVVRRILGPGAEECHVSAVLALCAGEGLGWTDVKGQRVRRERGRLYFRSETPPELPSLALPRQGSVRLDTAGIEISCRPVVFGEVVNSKFKTYHLKCENIYGDITVTAPHSGDRYRPYRRGCTKTLKSLFAERKYTLEQKARTPVLRDGKGIVLVPPFGAAERCVPQKGDAALEIVIKKI